VEDFFAEGEQAKGKPEYSSPKKTVEVIERKEETKAAASDEKGKKAETRRKLKTVSSLSSLKIDLDALENDDFWK